MSDDATALDRFVKQAGPLYSLPTVAVDILRITGQPKVELAELKQCLLRDPALVGKILRVVNSSLFGLSRGVSDLNQALALLGTKSVRLLVLGFSLPDDLFAGLAGDILRRYWHHTAVKATAAREISELIYRLPGEEAFIGGLLQDLGMLVLIQQLGDPYVRFLDRALAKAVDVNTAETVTLGFDHVQLSAALLQRWSLPEPIVAAIGVGHSAERMQKIPQSQRPLAQVLHLADLLAGMLAEGRTDWLGGLLEASKNYRPMSSTQLTSLVAALQEKVAQFAGVLSLELPKDTNYESIFRQAHERLTAAADDAAVALAVGRTNDIEMNVDAFDEAALLDDTASLSAAVAKFAQLAPDRIADVSRKLTSEGSASEESKTKLLAALAGASPSGTSEKDRAASSSGAAATATTVLSATASESVTAIKQAVSSEDLLLRRTTAAVAACRNARRACSLIFVEIDRFEQLSKTCEADETLRITHLVALACRSVEHLGTSQLQTSDSRYAMLLSNCDRSAAVAYGHQILDQVRRLGKQHADLAKVKLGVSVGVASLATPAKNFAPQSLMDSANRCLHGAQLSGGNTLKSIDVL
jgi:HD-like signal output (HDOD) protein/GGDEF domain-containing protein